MKELKNTKEIFDLLSHGTFISSNSTKEKNRRFFELLEEHTQAYRDLYSQIGFMLEEGYGYYYFSREEGPNLTSRVQAAVKWIDRLYFLKLFDVGICPGYILTQAEIETRLQTETEMDDLLRTMYADAGKDRKKGVEMLVKDMERYGYIELDNAREDKWKIMDSFRYLEEMVECIKIKNEEE